MTAGVVIGCGGGGGLLGLGLAVAVERVPRKAPLLQGPFPEVRAALTSFGGWTLVVVTAGLFAAIAARIDDGWSLPLFLVLAGALVALSAIDLVHFVLPNRIVYPVTGLSLGLAGLATVGSDDVESLVRAVACAAGSFGAFALLHMVSPRSMGFGDVKLAFLLGLDLGWLGVGETVLGLFLGFVYGAVIGVVLLATGARTRKDHVPFGPFLAAGALTAVLAGNTILDWYRG